MGIIKKFVLFFVANGIALYLASRYIAGFEIPLQFQNFILISTVFALINIFIRPIIKFALTPLIILTLGLGNLLVNALTLYLLDFLFLQVMINGLIPLISATILISLVNLVVIGFAKLI